MSEAKIDATAQAISLPFDEAIRVLAAKLNVTSSHWSDVWGKAHSRSFAVAGAATEALVADFREAVMRAIEEGESLGQFRKRFDAIVETHGWEHAGKPGWRARVIYETNLGSAYAAGRHAEMTEPGTLQAFPYWQYVHSGKKHFREQHKRWNGTVLRADDDFWRWAYPPNGYHCGCWVRPTTARDVARQGKSGPDPSPERVIEPYVVRKTGEVKRRTVGVDPGFDHNPGAEWVKIRAGGPAPETGPGT